MPFPPICNQRWPREKKIDTMNAMRVIVGLGNPGPEYEKTRHNAGFLFVDELARQFQLSWQMNKKCQAMIAKGEISYQGSTEDLCLVKPQTFMNASGQAVRAVLDYFYPEILIDEPQHLIVAHDDLDLEFGQVKLQKKGPKQHNGLLSLYQHLGFEDFWHLRFGVDSRAGQRSIPSADYVLLPMTSAELLTFKEAIKEAQRLILPV
jgi:PTH1 family peptidyl-tRNA hydrolase